MQRERLLLHVELSWFSLSNPGLNRVVPVDLELRELNQGEPRRKW